MVLSSLSKKETKMKSNSKLQLTSSPTFIKKYWEQISLIHSCSSTMLSVHNWNTFFLAKVRSELNSFSSNFPSFSRSNHGWLNLNNLWRLIRPTTIELFSFRRKSIKIWLSKWEGETSFWMLSTRAWLEISERNTKSYFLINMVKNKKVLMVVESSKSSSIVSLSNYFSHLGQLLAKTILCSWTLLETKSSLIPMQPIQFNINLWASWWARLSMKVSILNKNLQNLFWICWSADKILSKIYSLSILISIGTWYISKIHKKIYRHCRKPL